MAADWWRWPWRGLVLILIVGVRGARIEQQSGDGDPDRHKEVHVRGEMQDAIAEGGRDAQGLEIGLGVVAQELGIAEEEAGLGVVVGVPGGQRQHAT